MLDQQIAAEIRRKTQTYWDSEVNNPEFVEIAKGKEIGHRIADLVDDKTTALLTLNYITKHQHDGHGKRLTRSMGDVWLKHNGIYHAINVKTGVSSTNGQPNMVSLKKVLDALLLFQIDSYYLLMVKLEIEKPIRCAVFLVDMLDYLDYVTFDSGPGQIMLKAKAFFTAMTGGVKPAKRTIKQKVSRLFQFLEDGDRRLAENRKRSLDGYRQRVVAYGSQSRHIVTPATQSPLNLQ
jgi:hypothetical protein